MNIYPIQVTDEGVLIPLTYLQEATEFEWEVRNGHVLLRPKANGRQTQQLEKSWLEDLVGIAETRDPTASSRVEEILEAEIDRRSGWTLKPPLDESES